MQHVHRICHLHHVDRTKRVASMVRHHVPSLSGGIGDGLPSAASSTMRSRPAVSRLYLAESGQTHALKSPTTRP